MAMSLHTGTLTKLALGLMGQVKPAAPEPPAGLAPRLPAPSLQGGLPLMQALSKRQSQRSFSQAALDAQQLSDLLWAANGINRIADQGHTAPSAMNAQELDLYVALPNGLFLYEPVNHRLRVTVQQDVRRVTGYQDFVDHAALDLILVADYRRMSLVPAAQRQAYAYVAAGAICQNVYLYCASAGLATVVRAWFDRTALSQAMQLGTDQEVLMTQTVGCPKA
jgi:SagB-type dehydrogenase family enzyme